MSINTGQITTTQGALVKILYSLLYLFLVKSIEEKIHMSNIHVDTTKGQTLDNSKDWFK